MPTLSIPPQLDEVLQQNDALCGLVKTTASEFGTWLEQNNLRFFVEYTDHSLRHVEGVLKQANGLIRPECRGLITPADVAVLVLAALLHDCAMHLSPEGFVALVQGTGKTTVVDGFGDKRWDKLWEDFFAEARRFSARKLIAVFGDAEPIRHPRLDNPLEMTGRDLLLIGEFLRRHHHRLAHEIALFGVPGPGEDRLKIHTLPETQYIADLAGLVARGHRTPIRDCLGYLQPKYGSCKVAKGAHPVFVMALLRVADALQIEPERAPRLLDRVRKLRSPVSQLEWAMHQAIDDLNTHEYPETLLVQATPPNVQTYLRVKRLLEQIQQEMDAAWAIIGEVYGFDPSLREFGLTLRRVRSNLDDTAAFARQVDYIPCRAAFEVADADLLKLLIGPLYGHRPTFGIRELLQNALDAVRELEEYRRLHPELCDIELTPQEGDVVIAIDQEDDGGWWVTVSDRGIGMTVDTVREYFLKAGASLRRSDVWRQTFEDEEGKSRVLRSGRFGVGVLAAFLLSDEIHVSTRHVDAPGGIEFEARLDADVLDLQRTARPVGTAIRIRIDDQVREALLQAELGTRQSQSGEEPVVRDMIQKEWDWYCLEAPRVVRVVNKESLSQQWHLPPFKSKLPPGWHRIAHPDYQEIQWTYRPAPELTCNGILVSERVLSSSSGRFRVKRTYRSTNEIWGSGTVLIEDANHPTRATLQPEEPFKFARPNFSVFDSDANLPLNLQRTALSVDRYPFEDELIGEIVRDFVAFCLVTIPDRSLGDGLARKWYRDLHYPGCSYMDDEHRRFTDRRPRLFPWLSTEHGVSLLLEPWFFSALDTRSLLLVSHGADTELLGYMPEIESSSFKAVSGVDVPIQWSDRILRRVPEKTDAAAALLVTNTLGKCYWAAGDRWLDRFLIPGARMLIAHSAVNEFDFGEQLSCATEEWRSEPWVLYRFGECPEAEFDFERFATENKGPCFGARRWLPGWLIEHYFVQKKPASELSRLARAWRDLLGSPIIPFDPAERRRQFANAYKELKHYIDGWEALKREGKSPEP